VVADQAAAVDDHVPAELCPGADDRAAAEPSPTLLFAESLCGRMHDGGEAKASLNGLLDESAALVVPRAQTATCVSASTSTSSIQ
jgi:hypothetical protein